MFGAITTFGVVAVVLLAKTAAQHRRHAAATDVRLCRGCGGTLPPHARFCSHCGRSVSN